MIINSFYFFRGTSLAAVNMKQRLAAKKRQYEELKRIENDLQSKREQMRAKKNDLF